MDKDEKPAITADYYEEVDEHAKFGGWIEPADKAWIIFLDTKGRPTIYYPEREESGAVASDPQVLFNG